MGSGQSTAGVRQQAAAAGAPAGWDQPEDDQFSDPMAAFMLDPPHHQTDDELADDTGDEIDDLEYDDDERDSPTLRKLRPLSRFVSVKMALVVVVVVACLGKEFIVENSPYVADLMGWRAPSCEFDVPATSRLRVASIRVKTDTHAGRLHRRHAVELSYPNMTSIYPVRDMEQPEKPSHEFKVLVCDNCNRVPSTPLEVSELPPLIAFPLEKKASSDSRIKPAKKSSTSVCPRSKETTGDVNSTQTSTSRPKTSTTMQSEPEGQIASSTPNATEVQMTSIQQKDTEAPNATIAQNTTEAQQDSIAQTATEAQKASIDQKATEAQKASITQAATEAVNAQLHEKRRRELYDRTTPRALYRRRYDHQNATRPVKEDK